MLLLELFRNDTTLLLLLLLLLCAGMFSLAMKPARLVPRPTEPEMPMPPPMVARWLLLPPDLAEVPLPPTKDITVRDLMTLLLLALALWQPVGRAEPSWNTDEGRLWCTEEARPLVCKLLFLWAVLLADGCCTGTAGLIFKGVGVLELPEPAAVAFTILLKGLAAGAATLLLELDELESAVSIAVVILAPMFLS
jgi:hypothetical protein